MNKNASVAMAAAVAVAGILTLAILAIAAQHQGLRKHITKGAIITGVAKNNNHHVATMIKTRLR